MFIKLLPIITFSLFICILNWNHFLQQSHSLFINICGRIQMELTTLWIIHTGEQDTCKETSYSQPKCVNGNANGNVFQRWEKTYLNRKVASKINDASDLTFIFVCGKTALMIQCKTHHWHWCALFILFAYSYHIAMRWLFT